MQKTNSALLIFLLSLLVAMPICAEPKKILLIGDSLSKPKPGGYTEESVRIFADTLAEKLGSGYEVANIARAGSSAELWKRDFFQVYALDEGPVDLVIILLGSNDAKGRHAEVFVRV